MGRHTRANRSIRRHRRWVEQQEQTCLLKERYEEPSEADRIARGHSPPARSYFCVWCCGWHLTTKVPH